MRELATRKNYEVYSAYNQHKPHRGTPIQFDVSNRKAVEKIKPEAVIHAAALTNMDKRELDKELAWRINVEGTRNIAESCKKPILFSFTYPQTTSSTEKKECTKKMISLIQ